MENLSDVNDLINSIDDLDIIITKEIVKSDIKKTKSNNEIKEVIEELLDVNIDDLSNSKLEEMLVEIYLKQSPYLGYNHVFWNTKKQYLKNNYNIEWYTPEDFGFSGD